MAKEFAKKFYKSGAWKKCRAGFISYRVSIDGGLCQRCGRRLGYIVHHKEYITQSNINNPDVLLCWDNLEYICKPCHEEEHGYCGQAAAPSVQFDAQGNPLPYSPPKRKTAEVNRDRAGLI